MSGPSVEILEAITRALFDRLKPSTRWRFLIKRLDLPIRAELVRGISSSRLPNKEDWANIFRPVSYTAGRGWHLWLVFAVATAVAIGDMVYLLRFQRPFAISAVVFSVVLLFGTVLHLGIMVVKEDPCEYLAMFAPGPFLTDDLYQNPLAPAAVKLSVKDPYPGPEVKFTPVYPNWKDYGRLTGAVVSQSRKRESLGREFSGARVLLEELHDSGGGVGGELVGARMDEGNDGGANL